MLFGLGNGNTEIIRRGLLKTFFLMYLSFLCSVNWLRSLYSLLHIWHVSFFDVEVALSKVTFAHVVVAFARRLLDFDATDTPVMRPHSFLV